MDLLFSGWSPPYCPTATEEFANSPRWTSGDRTCRQGYLLTFVPLPCWLRLPSFLHSVHLNGKLILHHISKTSSTQVHMRVCPIWHYKIWYIFRWSYICVVVLAVSELLYTLQWCKEVGYNPALVAAYHSQLVDWGLPGQLYNLLPLEGVLETLYSRWMTVFHSNW